MLVRVELRRDAGRFDRRSGPWIRRRQVSRVLGPPDPTALAELVSHRGETLGFGLYSPDSGIVVRLLSLGATPPSETWLDDRISVALAARASLGLGVEGGDTDGYREINSEGDGLPGLVVDRFGDQRVIQVTTAPMAARIEAIAAQLRACIGVEGTVVLAPEAAAVKEHFTPGCRRFDAHGAELSSDTELSSDAPHPGFGPLHWREGELLLQAPAPPGQKTGAYHDQRLNRRRFAALAAVQAGPVLDLGCHVGGFAIAAARARRAAGAAPVPTVAVDQSKVALAAAEANAAANEVTIETVRADMFGALDDPALAGPFGAIVFDPPKVAGERRDLKRALGAMTRVVTKLLARLDRGGVMAVCSCSHHLGVPELDAAMFDAAERCGRACTRIATWGPGPDHPVWLNHAQGEYLRVAVYQRR